MAPGWRSSIREAGSVGLPTARGFSMIVLPMGIFVGDTTSSFGVPAISAMCCLRFAIFGTAC